MQCWFHQSDTALRHCFSTTKWYVFQDNNINTYVNGYIDKCTDDVVLINTRLPDHRSYVLRDVRAKLKAETNAYNSGNLDEYRKSSYVLQKATSSA